MNTTTKICIALGICLLIIMLIIPFFSFFFFDLLLYKDKDYYTKKRNTLSDLEYNQFKENDCANY